MSLGDDNNKRSSAVSNAFGAFAEALKAENSNVYSLNPSIVSTNRVKKFFGSLEQSIREIARKDSVLGFLFSFFLYIYERLRAFFIIMSVIVDILFDSTAQFKRSFVRRVFWGRQNILTFTIQVVTVFSMVFVALSYFYRYSTSSVSRMFTLSESRVLAQDLLVQNSSTNTQVPTDRGRVDLVEYTVRSGDTLSRIAQNYNISVDTLLWVNDLDSSFLKVGQKLLIPPGDGILIKVKKGDTLESLAKKYNSNPQTIADANLLNYPFALSAGQQIFIPDAQPLITASTSSSVTTKPKVYSGVIHIKKPVIKIGSAPVDPSVGRFVGWPVQNGGRVTQCYHRWHNGVDIADRSAPNLVAAAPGTVTFAGCQSGSCPAPGHATGGYGLAWTVIIDHGNGYSTVYGHMSKISVKKEQKVAAGQVIGRMGQSGTAYGIHVHFMVLKGKGWHHVNPAAYMKNHICGY